MSANDPKQTFLHSRERGRPHHSGLPRSSTTSVHLNAPNPVAQVIEKHEPASAVDTELVDSLKALDPERPIREADITQDLNRNVLRLAPRIAAS